MMNAVQTESAKPRSSPKDSTQKIRGFLNAFGAAMLGFVSGTAWAAFVLSELGRFNPYIALLAGFLLAALYFFASKRHFGNNGSTSGFLPCSLIAIALAFASLFATLPASEMVLGGWDPGVYIHTASKLASEGSIQIDEGDFREMTPGQLHSVSADLHGIPEPFMGMRLLPNGNLSPQFFHLYPSLMAVADSFFGTAGCLGLNAFLNIGCILALYALAGRIFGWRWGLLAAFLLALNAGQIWQSKFQTAELLVQLFLLTGSNFLLCLDRPEQRMIASGMAGLSFALALLTRYDSILFIVPLLLIMLWQAASSKTSRITLLGVILILTGALHAWMHICYLAPHYHPVPGLVLPGLMLAGICALFILAAGLLLPRKAIQRAHSFAIGLRPWTALLFAAFVVWAWYLRPRLTLDGRVAEAIGRILAVFDISELPAWIVSMNAWNMHRLAAITGGFALLLSMAGIVLMIWKMDGIWRRAWLTCSTLVAAMLITKPFHDQFMMWMTRRYISVVIPLLVMGTVYALKCIHDLLARSSLAAARAITTLALAVMLMQAAPGSLAMARLRNWPGLLNWCREINTQIAPRSYVFCDQPGFAAPFRFIFDHHSYQLDIEQPQGPDEIRSLIAESVATRGEAYFLSLAEPPQVPGIEVAEVREHYLKSSTVQHPYVGVPRSSRGRGGRFRLYRMIPGQ